jgi:WD40 repeat protein/serine/threonine protein kinase
LSRFQIADPASREGFLDRACATDPALRQRVAGLMAALRRAGEFLQEPAAAACIPGVAPGFRPKDAHDGPGTVIGPYKLLEQIGEGGFGVVYMAEQQQPVRRQVALKIIKPGMDTKQVVARFEAERQALALMDHPNIAHVLDANATDPGRPYFVMELIRGVPITQFCDDNRLTPRERLELFVTVCQAVQHAHQKGIIHRDLKPSNVLVTLLDGTPVVKVIDFGIAKALGQERLTDKTLFTGFPLMIGTPLYMSPEQAEMSGQDVDTRTDIYALGVLLYELLTGTTPFDKERLKELRYDEIRRIIREEEPVKPSTRISTLGHAAITVSANRKSEPQRLSQLFRGELDWIVIKALEKDRNRRYDTASALAADVQRYLDDEPVQAYPPSALSRFRKFARRNRAALMTASAVALAVLVAVVGLATSTVLIAREQQATTNALRDATEAKAGLEQALEREQQNSYYQRIALADREWSANNLGRMEQLLEECPADLRGWEWHYLKRLRYKTLPPLRHDSMVLSLAFSPTSHYLASGSRDGVIQLWDTHIGLPLATRFRVGEHMVEALAFSPDGLRLASACSDGRVRMWDVQAGMELPEWKAHKTHLSPVCCLAFSPDGQRLASASHSYGWEGQPAFGEVKVWNAASGQYLFTLGGQTNAFVAFSPDGHRLASMGHDRTLKVFEATTGRELQSRPYGDDQKFGAGGLAFSPDGETLASVRRSKNLSDGEVVLWDARTGQERLTLRGHIGTICTIWSLAFSPDGHRLASAGWDRTVKLWDVATGQETLTLRGHENLIRAVAFSPNGHQLASASDDRTVRIWDATPWEEKPGEEPLTLRVHPADVWAVAFHPDGQRLATAVDDKGVDLWDSQTGKLLFTFPDSQRCWSIALSPDGQRLAGGAGQPGEVKVWDVRTGQKLHSLPLKSKNVAWRVAFSPDSKHLVAANWDRTVRVWDTATGDELQHIPAHAYAISSLALSPDGKSAVTSSADETVKGWDVATGRRIFTLQRPHPGIPKCVAFRPDGQLLASASADGTIKFWDPRTWKSKGEDLRDRTVGVECLEFSPDGRQLAWGGTDATVKIWDTQTKEIQTLRGHTSWVKSIAFSPDGKRIASASLDGTVKIWKTPPLPESTGVAKP